MITKWRSGVRGELDYRRRLHEQLKRLEVDARRSWGFAFEKVQRPYLPEGKQAWLLDLYDAVASKNDLQIEQLFRLERIGVMLSDAAILGKPYAFEDATRKALSNTADLAARKLSHQIGESIESKFIRSRASEWLRGNAAQFIQGVTDEAKGVIRTVLAEGVDAGLSTARIAESIRDALPLTEKWASAVVKYESELLGKGLPKDEAARLARIYSERLKTARANNIARTEVHRASRNAERLMVEESVDQGLIDPEVYEREWVGIVGDGRICIDCYRAHGTRAAIGGTFPNGSETTEAHATNERCSERLVRKDEKTPKIPPFVAPKGGGSLRPMTPAEAARVEAGSPK